MLFRASHARRILIAIDQYTGLSKIEIRRVMMNTEKCLVGMWMKSVFMPVINAKPRPEVQLFCV